MEEGMRRTLLRGMSAMNMEAMQVLNEARGSGVGVPVGVGGDDTMVRGVPVSSVDSGSDSLRGYATSRTAAFSGGHATPRQR